MSPPDKLKNVSSACLLAADFAFRTDFSFNNKTLWWVLLINIQCYTECLLNRILMLLSMYLADSLGLHWQPFQACQPCKPSRKCCFAPKTSAALYRVNNETNSSMPSTGAIWWCWWRFTFNPLPFPTITTTHFVNNNNNDNDFIPGDPYNSDQPQLVFKCKCLW